MEDAILVVHAAAGAAGLVLGAVALAGAARGRDPGWTAAAYHWLVLVVCVSAVGLAALDLSELWFFIPIAAGSYAFALRATLAERGRAPGWREPFLRGLGGAYIALVTALVVVSVGSPVAWVLPTLIGAPLLESAIRRLTFGPGPALPGG